MICLNCGRTIDANNPICPYCGTPTDEDAGYYGQDGAYADNGGADSGYDYEYEQQASDQQQAAPKKAGFSMPGINLATVFSMLSLIVSIICLVSISGVKASVRKDMNSVVGSIYSVQNSIYNIDDKLSGLDTTIASVQSEAYNQLASQSITITKDVTALTGPVTKGKYNQMFIVTAKGNLNLVTSFDWQKYNEATGGWVSIVFTGTATSNDEYGLRIENGMEGDAYKTILWANGITKAAEGSYRCVITDNSGIVKTSGQAIVQVSEG